MEHLSDLRLIHLCKENHQEAYDELFRRYYPIAYKLAYHITKSDADAHDVAQESMLSVYKHIQDLKQPQYFPLWLKRIVVGKCNRIFRKNKHVDYMSDDALLMQHVKDNVLDHNPVRYTRSDYDKEMLVYFIELLPDTQEEVTRLFYLRQLSIKEISRSLHISQGTVKSRLHAAKKKLREYVSQYEEREGVRLNFRDTSMSALFGTGIFHSIKEYGFFSSTSFKYGMITLLIGGSVGIIGTVSRLWDGDDDAQEYPAEIETSSRFPLLQLSDMEISNAQDAFFKLLMIADNQNAMEHLTDEQRADMHILYEGLKEHGGIYYYELSRKDCFSALKNK
ncbi:MAG: sigma-70 family RNA polymerase sigma factor [Erysipelotrichaceae bacterium]|nr:sigma-70 family RNA polymerase sigma factor [Erysipelotrichaceae bacterium]